MGIFKKIMELEQGQKAGVVVTVVDKKGSGPTETGSRMLVYSNGKTTGTVGGGELEKLATEKAMQVFETRENCLEEYNLEENDGSGQPTEMICGGTAQLFFEYFAPQTNIYIFGGGHIGQALVYHLKNLDYKITIIDDRREVLDKIKGADNIIHDDFENALENENVVPDSFFIIATYQHKYDGVVLNRIYKSSWSPRYIGTVSSRHKRKTIFENLKKEVSNPDLDICYLPVGLDIGGASPHEIAISIISEIQKIRYEKSGKHLRDIN